MNFAYIAKRWSISFVSTAATIALGFATAVIFVAGCDEPAAVSSAGASSSTVARPVNELTLALGALREMSQPNGNQSAIRGLFYLNQWLGRQEKSADWTPDPMLAQLPATLQPGLEAVKLDEANFSGRDLDYLQECLWLHDIAERVRTKPAPERRQAWLKRIEKEQGPLAAEQLAAAESLFDWTISNIQLDPLPPAPPAPQVVVGDDNIAARSAPLQGIVGPGYSQTALQILIHGHGDAWERSRIFLLLARQAGIEGAMLAILDPKSAGVSQPWACALLIGDQLYLFDAAIGLPLIGAEPNQVATLSELVQRPDLLRAFDLPKDDKYPIVADDLKRVVALMDASPESLTRRMDELEKGMPAAGRVRLATHPTALQKKLRNQKALGQVSLWRVPFEADLYQAGLMFKLRSDPNALAAWSRRESIFQIQNPLRQGRDLQFRGNFVDEDVTPGARTHYLSLRIPEATLDRLATSAVARKRLGFDVPLPEDPAARSAALEDLTGIIRLAKQNATYWLALSYLDAGSNKSAIEWLERTLTAAPTSPWQAGARYNLGRGYEALGDMAKACEYYRADSDSPQRSGNLLRAHLLEQQTKAASTEPSTDEKAASEPAASAAADEPTATEPAEAK